MAVKSCFQLNIYTLIDLEMTSKLSKLKWKLKPLACRRVQVSLQSFEHFYVVISMVKENVDCWELFSIIFSVFDVAMSILSWKIVFEG